MQLATSSVTLEPDFSCGVHAIGRFRAGDLELAICDDDDFEQVKPLLLQSYRAS